MNPPVSHGAELCAALLFAAALIHTFSTRFFEHLAHSHPRHAGLWHLLGEVEVVFGFWACLLVFGLFALDGGETAIAYLESRNFAEPMFVFTIMVVAGTRPVLVLAAKLVRGAAAWLPMPGSMGTYFIVLSLVPLLGSFITEPAAMTLAALMLRKALFGQTVSGKLKYATLGVLFVNVSIGGTLTPFAAPPVLMVASKWNWDLGFMLSHFGGRAALAVVVNAAAATLVFRGELARLVPGGETRERPVPTALTLAHLAFLAAIVLFAHHPVVFMGAFLFFLGVATAYQRHQSPLILREAMLVAFFLAGLVVLGGLQQWWLEPVLMSMSSTAVFYGAAGLTALTDNAALTYLGSLVEGLSPDFQTALVAGAVTGGGLTLIANAPNPAGAAILKGRFPEGAISPVSLFLGALPPTLVAVAAFRLL